MTEKERYHAAWKDHGRRGFRLLAALLAFVLCLGLWPNAVALGVLAMVPLAAAWHYHEFPCPRCGARFWSYFSMDSPKAWLPQRCGQCGLDRNAVPE